MNKQFNNTDDFIKFYNTLDDDTMIVINQKYKLATIKDSKLYRWNSKGSDIIEIKKVKSIEVKYNMIDKTSFEYRFQDMENRIGVHAMSI